MQLAHISLTTKSACSLIQFDQPYTGNQYKIRLQKYLDVCGCKRSDLPFIFHWGRSMGTQTKSFSSKVTNACYKQNEKYLRYMIDSRQLCNRFKNTLPIFSYVLYILILYCNRVMSKTILHLAQYVTLYL